MNTAINIIKKLGGQTYLVGGCVRDYLLGQDVKDIDIATNLTPSQVLDKYPNANIVGKSFGVVIIKENNQFYEIATFRKDGRYIDCRHPESIEFGTIEDDAKRRDFTCNALYMDPINNKIIDLVDGQKDIKNNILRCVGNPYKRFSEDALRIIRALRFVSKNAFLMHRDTFRALCNSSHLLKHIANERIAEELTRMLTGPNPDLALDWMERTGILRVILMPIQKMKGCEQGKKHHPEGDVFEHTKRALASVPKEERSKILMWAVFLHDVGKPYTREIDENGKISFVNHDYIGSKITKKLLRRFKFSNHEIDMIVSAVADHMRYCTVHNMKRSTLRRLISQEHHEITKKVNLADASASNTNKRSLEFLTKVEAEFAKEDAMPDPLLTGKDLIDRLDLTPGPIFGTILKQIYEMQLNDEIETAEEAIEQARNIIP